MLAAMTGGGAAAGDSQPQLVAERELPAPGRHLYGIAWDGARIWHADAGTERLYCIDPSDGSVKRTLACTVDELGLIVRVSPETGEEIARHPVGGTPTGIGWDGERLWYADHEARALVAARPT
jgi:sugar lactone lactonase YvrE